MNKVKSCTNFGLLFRHHVELLLAHPGFSFSCIEVVLLGLMGLLESGVAFLRLLDDQAPQLLQVSQTGSDRLHVGAVGLQDALAALEYVVTARLMALDLLL